MTENPDTFQSPPVLHAACGNIEGLSCRLTIWMNRIHKEQSIVTGTISPSENFGVTIGGKQNDRVPGKKGYTFWEIQPGGP